jgi:hypothetical protein
MDRDSQHPGVMGALLIKANPGMTEDIPGKKVQEASSSYYTHAAKTALHAELDKEELDAEKKKKAEHDKEHGHDAASSSAAPAPKPGSRVIFGLQAAVRLQQLAGRKTTPPPAPPAPPAPPPAPAAAPAARRSARVAAVESSSKNKRKRGSDK